MSGVYSQSQAEHKLCYALIRHNKQNGHISKQAGCEVALPLLNW